jgi:tRNA(fMet)-specific endonuclease VapC
MSYFLDTNICIYFLKGTYPALPDKLYSHAVSEIKIASIVKAELLYGAAHSKRVTDNTEKVEKFLLPFEIIPFDGIAADYYARIRAKLAKKGTPVGPNDLIIAATVMANQGILVTNNEQEFSRITGLSIENWA